MQNTLPPPPPGVTFVGTADAPPKRKVNPFGRPLLDQPVKKNDLPPPPPGVTFVGDAPPVQSPARNDLLPPPPPGVTFVGDAPEPKKPEPRSALGEFASQVKAGATIDLPRMTGQAIKAVTPKDSAPYRYGEGVVQRSEERAAANTYDDRTREEGFAGLAGDVGRALVPSVAVPLTAAAAAVSAKLIGAGAVTVTALKGIGALGTIALFGSSQAQESFEEIRDDMITKGIDPAEADSQARKAGALAGVLEGGMEGVASWFGGGKFIASVAGRIGLKTTAKTATDIASDFATKRTRVDVAKAIAKDLAIAYPAEMLTEFAQEGGNVLIHQAFGHDDGRDPWDSAVHGAKVAFGLTTLLAPLGVGGRVREARVRNEVADAVTNPDAEPELRKIAVRMIAHEMGEIVGPAPAQAWAAAALKEIDGNLPVDLSPTGTSQYIGETIKLGIEERINELRGEAVALREAGNEQAATELESRITELEDALDADLAIEPANLEPAPGTAVDADTAIDQVNEARKRVNLPALPDSVADAYRAEVAANPSALNPDRLQALESGAYAPDNPAAAVVDGPGSKAASENTAFLDSVAKGEPVATVPPPVEVPVVGQTEAQPIQTLEDATVIPAVQEVRGFSRYSRFEQSRIAESVAVVDRIEESRARENIEPLPEQARANLIERQVSAAIGGPLLPVSQHEETRWSIGEHLNVFTGKKSKAKKRAKAGPQDPEMVTIGGRGPFLVTARVDNQVTLYNPVDKSTFAADAAALQPFTTPVTTQDQSLPAAPADANRPVRDKSQLLTSSPSAGVAAIPLTDAPDSAVSAVAVEPEPTGLNRESAGVSVVSDPAGKPLWQAVTPQDDVQAFGHWDVIDIDTLVTSDRPGFDQELQPRDRSTVSSKEQIARIASNPDFNRLNESATTDDGAPIIAPDGTVLSGNGRIMGLRQAYTGTAASRYKTSVEARAAELGLSTDGKTKPVLVRVLDGVDGADLKRFVELSNREKILQRTAAELAVADSAMLEASGIMDLFNIGNSDNVMAASNRDFLTQFVIGTGDQSLRKSDGRFATDNLKPRVERAILMAIMGKTERGREVAVSAIERAEGLGIRPELAGIMRAGGAILNLAKNKPELDISINLAEAVEALIQYKQEFVDGKTSSVTGWMAQQDMFAQPMSTESLIVLQGIAERGTMSGVFEFLTDYVKQARTVDTSTIDMFADLPVSTPEDMLRRARNRAKEQLENELRVRLAVTETQPSIGQQGQNRPAAESPRGPDQTGSQVDAPSPSRDRGGPATVQPGPVDQTARGDAERGGPGGPVLKKPVNAFGVPRKAEQPVSRNQPVAGSGVPGTQPKNRPTGMGKPRRTADSPGGRGSTAAPDGNRVVEGSQRIPDNREGQAVAPVAGPAGNQRDITDAELSNAAVDAQTEATTAADRLNELKEKQAEINRNLQTAYDRRERITVNAMLPTDKARADLEKRRENVTATINDLETERGIIEAEVAGAVGIDQTASAQADVMKDGLRAVADGVAAVEDVKFSVGKPIWYSQLQRVLEAKMPARATVANVRGMIDPAKGSGVKAEEIEWTGLKDWLDSKNPLDKVTKAEVLAAIQPVEVRDVVKGKSEAAVKAFDGWTDDQVRNHLLDVMMIDEADVDAATTRADLLALAEDNADLDNAAPEYDGTPKYFNFQTPGGKNYRELLLALPDSSKIEIDTFGDKRYSQLTTEEKARVDSARNKMRSDFDSPHYDEPNILVHVRFNERTDTDGRRVLFIEEIQSDWHQQGREKGYRDNNPYTPDAVSMDLYQKTYDQLDAMGQNSVDLELDARRRLSSEGVPNAPFKNNAWAKLALKRSIRWAAENEFDAVAWTTGEQQAERYDLSKQVDKITYNKNPTDKQPAKDVYIAVHKDDRGGIILQGQYSYDELSGVVGKEVADKIQTGDGYGTLSGLDLKVGGEGMKGFYDRILVNLANEIGKKYGARVGESSIEAGTTTEWDGVTPSPNIVDVHSLLLSDSLVDSVLYDGQPLFKGAQGAQPKPIISTTKARTAAAPLLSKIAPGVVEIVGSASDLPASERAMMDRSRRKQGITGDIRAATMPNGKIYIFADAMRSEADAVAAVAHEVFERGVLSVMDRAGVDAFLKSIMDGRLEKNSIYRVARERVSKNYPGLAEKMDTDAGRVAFATEVMAHIAENRKRLPSLWKRIVRTLRQFMARLVQGTRIEGYFDEISDPEIEAFIDRMLERGATVPGVDAITSARYSAGVNEKDGDRRPSQQANPQGDELANLDREYLDAVERGDMETTQRLVDEAAKAAGVGTWNSKIKPIFVDPSSLVFTETQQNRLDAVRRDFPEGEGYQPIVVVNNNGNRRIIDGHNRASIAKERGDSISVVELSEQEYQHLKNAGYYDYHIVYAALVRAGEFDEAQNTASQLPGGDVEQAGRDAFDSLVGTPIIRDDQGNVIPLSKRFSPFDPPRTGEGAQDILFSVADQNPGGPRRGVGRSVADLLAEIEELKREVSTVAKAKSKSDADSRAAWRALLERKEQVRRQLMQHQSNIYQAQRLIARYLRMTKIPLAERARFIPSIIELAKFKRPETVSAYYMKTLAEIDTKSEYYAAEEPKQEIRAILAGGQPRLKNMYPSGNRTPDTYIELNKIRDMLSKDATWADAQHDRVYKMAAARLEMDPEQVDAMALSDQERHELFLVDTYANLRDKTADEAARGLAALQDMVKRGMFEHQAKMAERRLEMTRLVDAAQKVITGGNPLLVKADESQKDLRDKNTANAIIQAISDFDTKHQSWEWLLDKLSKLHKQSGPLEGPLKYWADLAATATYAADSGRIAVTTRISTALQQIYGTTNNRLLTKMLRDNSREVSKTGVMQYATEYQDGPGVYSVVPGSGKELALSRNQAYYLWQKFQDPTQANRLMHNGYTPETLRQLEAFMGDKVLTYARWQLNEFFPWYYDTINPVYRELFFVDLPFNDRYSPIVTDIDTIVADEKTTMDDSYKRPSALNRHLKSRVENKRDYRLMDGDTLLMQHVGQMEHFKNWALTVRDMRAVFGNREIQKAIRQFHGRGMQRVLNGFLNDFARGGQDRAMAIGIIDRMRSNFTKAVVASPVTTLKQLTSIPAFMVDIPSSAWTAGFAEFFTNPVKYGKFLYENSDMLKSRFDTGFERDVRLAMAQSAPDRFGGKLTFIEAFTWFTRAGDMAAILSGGWPVYKYHYNQNIKKGMTPDAAKKAAIFEFNKAAQRSQQAGDVKDLGSIQRGGSIGKLFTMFMTAPLAYYRLWSSAVRGLATGRGSKRRHAKVLFVTHVILPVAFQWVSDAFRWGDDEDEDERMVPFLPKSQARTMITNPFEGMIVAGLVLDRLIAAYQRERLFGNFSSSIMPVGAIADDIVRMGQTGGRLRNDGFSMEDFLQFLEDAAAAGGKLTGTPTEPIMRMATGIHDVINGDTEKPFRRVLGYSRYAVGEI